MAAQAIEEIDLSCLNAEFGTTITIVLFSFLVRFTSNALPVLLRMLSCFE
jgi:hypothetical protein